MHCASLEFSLPGLSCARQHARKATWAWATKAPSRLGRKKPDRARLDLDYRTEMNGLVCFSAEQNPRRRPLAFDFSTLAYSPLSPAPSTSPPERARAAASGGVQRHGKPPRRRARPPQGERAAVERHHRGAQIWRVTSGTTATRAASVRARPMASRGRVDVSASRTC
jgi:hypothetical protein